jgi:pyroglutamyl-peptidase
MPDHAPVLVSGFEPFGGQTINASWEAVSLLPDTIASHPVRRLLLPVEFCRSADLLTDALLTCTPAAVIAVGEAQGRAELCVERVAVNVMAARIPDNAGFQPDGEPIVPGGPAEYVTQLPVDACVAAAQAAGVPARPSDSAGQYVCNQLMYRLLHHLACADLHIPAGFIHVPYMLQQVAERPELPAYSADDLARALAAAIAACLC